MSCVEVAHVPTLRRFEITVDDRLAGFADYEPRDDRYFFTHTEIDDEFGGHGIGSLLIRGALDDMNSIGATIVPLCSFVAHFIERHPEYHDLVDYDCFGQFTEPQKLGSD